MPSLTVPGAQLYYELSGSGPLLVLVAGAGGWNFYFRQIAPILSAAFTVLTYDRRGHARSPLTGEQDYSQRLERDADDIAEMVEAVSASNGFSTDSSTYLLGNSSGAIVALTAFTRHPSLFKKAVIHEPPMFKALLDPEQQEKEMAETRKVYDIYRAKGMIAALGYFSQDHLAHEDVAVLLGPREPQDAAFESGNMLYWFERELYVYPSAEVPWSVLEKPEIKEKLIMGVSENASEGPSARTAKAFAERLQLGSDGLVNFPGAHLGFATQPDKFATRLRECLGV